MSKKNAESRTKTANVVFANQAYALQGPRRGERGVNATSHFTVYTVESLNKDRQGRKDKVYGE